MEDSTKIALGILGAAGILLIGHIAYREYQRQRDIEEAQAVIQGWTEQLQQAAAESSRTAQRDARQRAEADERRRQALLLRSDEQCLAGSVVTVRGNVYTQLIGQDGRPEACVGRQRLDGRH
ncbi:MULTISPECIES: hypothetical protein [Dyella]|uniref:DUF2570 domain-containing protein n=2 Tax=Dyella TaxID=231454 RepID=A0A4R0YZX7_9GAMM|nr:MULTISPECIES: hypothetical protein [Dyella]TBR39404.1 hypothetical protein EYV96_04075 [Dyella terrae]TCI13009.1 hypothetical protein EZM97_06790 [Dyella soli]